MLRGFDIYSTLLTTRWAKLLSLVLAIAALFIIAATMTQYN